MPIIFEQRIASGLDDVEERPTGSMSFTSNDLELVDDNPNRPDQTVGLRFGSIGIPQGAIITSAYIQFQVDEVGSAATSLQIRGEDADNAAAFANVRNNVSSRATTDSLVSWTPAAWTTVGAAGLDQRTPDLAAIVQEIVDRQGWTANNAMVFSIVGSGTRTAEAFEGSAAGAPLLHIEYELPPGGNEPPSLDLDMSATGTGYAGTFVENSGGVVIADSDLLITDSDDTDLESAFITLTNAQADDVLVVNVPGLPAGISVDNSSTPTSFLLTGSATLADYQTALRQVSFINTGEDPGSSQRLINVTVNDGQANSNTAIATIGVDQAPDAADDIAATQVDTAVTTGDVLANDDAGDAPASITNFDTISMNGGPVSYNGDGTFDYMPPSGFAGTDSFTYTITDTDGDSSSAAVSVSVLDTQPIVFEQRIASGLDDVEERPTGSMSFTSNDLELVDDNPNRPNQTVGLRFSGTDIPQGAIITSAYIQFQVDEVGSSATSLQIRGEDADNAAAFANARNNVSSRATTDSLVSWTPAAWTTVGAAGLDQRTPDLAAIVQEIVDRPGWTANNAMVFSIVGLGTRTAEAFEGSAAGAPLLHIEYVPPPGGNQAPVLDLDASAAGSGYVAAYVSGLGGVAVSDVDSLITDADDTNLESALVTLTNPQIGDLLVANASALPAGINVDNSSTPTSLLLTGSATLADYQTALRQVLFDNTLADPDVSDRLINVVVNDGQANSNTAAATVTISVPPGPPTIAVGDGTPAPQTEGPAAQIAFVLTLSEAANEDVLLDYSTVNGTAVAGSDFVGINAGQALISAGSQSTTVFVDLLNDADPEGPESFGLQLDLAQLVPSGTPLTITDNTGSGTIIDDDFVQNDPMVVAIHDMRAIGSPDPSGLAYVPFLDTLFLSDSEVNQNLQPQPPFGSPINLFALGTDGNFIDSFNLTDNFTDEPTGLAFNSVNGSMYISDDDADSIFWVDPANPTVMLGQFDTIPLGAIDAEDVAVDQNNGDLFIVNGVNRLIVETTSTGAFVSSISVPSVIEDPEALAFDSTNGQFYIGGGFSANIWVLDRGGNIVDTIDILANFRNPIHNGRVKVKDLEFAPSSDPTDDPNVYSLYVADYGNSHVDDGRLFEIDLGDFFWV